MAKALLCLVAVSFAANLPWFPENEFSPGEAKCTPGLTPTPGSLKNFSAVIIVTSHSVLGAQNCTTCKPTGVYPEELMAPYYMFKDAGINTSVVSIEGGVVPIDPSRNSTS